MGSFVFIGRVADLIAVVENKRPEARIAEMMEPNSLEHPRPSACELLQKPPFSSMPLPSAWTARVP